MGKEERHITSSRMDTGIICVHGLGNVLVPIFGTTLVENSPHIGQEGSIHSLGGPVTLGVVGGSASLIDPPESTKILEGRRLKAAALVRKDLGWRSESMDPEILHCTHSDLRLHVGKGDRKQLLGEQVNHQQDYSVAGIGGKE